MITQEAVGAIKTAEKIRELVSKAPAGGIFHDAVLTEVGGLEVPGYVQAAAFTIAFPDGVTLDITITGQS